MKKAPKAKSKPAVRHHAHTGEDLSPIMKIGVVFVIVMGMLLLAAAVRITMG